MSIRLNTDTAVERSCRKNRILQSAKPAFPLISHRRSPKQISTIRLGMTRTGKIRSESAMFAMKISVVFFILLELTTTIRIKEFPTRATNITIKLASVAPNLSICVSNTAVHGAGVQLEREPNDVEFARSILIRKRRSVTISFTARIDVKEAHQLSSHFDVMHLYLQTLESDWFIVFAIFKANFPLGIRE